MSLNIAATIVEIKEFVELANTIGAAITAARAALGITGDTSLATAGAEFAGQITSFATSLASVLAVVNSTATAVTTAEADAATA